MNMKYTKSVFGRALILAVGGIVLMSFPRGSQSGTSSSQKKENKLAEDTEAAKRVTLVINSKKGLIIMTGCSHPGIENIVKKFKEMFPLKKIYLAVGGFHRPPETAVKGLRTLGVEKVAPSHCTGDQVIELFRKEYGDDFLEYGVGAIIHIK